jgi:hypothetical protein
MQCIGFINRGEISSTQVLTAIFQAPPADGAQILRKVGTAVNARSTADLEPLILTTVTDNVSRDSSVGIATGYGLDDQGGESSSPGRVKIFHFSISSRPALGSTQPPIKMGTGGSFPGVKRQEREADHSSPTSAEDKKKWIYTSTPPCVFMA